MPDANTSRIADDAAAYRGQLRLPAPLAKRIKSTAARERRSMNSQIIVLLERALPDDKNEAAEAAPTVPAE